MNYYEHHLGDYAQATAHLSWLEDLAYRRLICHYYATELPIPADVKQACRLVRATSKQEREAVETVLHEFFEIEEDGWHQARCDSDLDKFHESAPDRESKRENTRVRQQRTRERRKQLFDLLRSHGQVPAFDTPMSALLEMVSRVTSHDTLQPVTRDVTHPVTRDATATQTPDPRPQSQTPETKGAPDLRAGEACKAMKQAGLQAVNPSDPRLIALIEAGITAAELQDVAAEAVPRGKGFPWVLATAEGRRRDASKVVNLPAQQREANPWDGAR